MPTNAVSSVTSAQTATVAERGLGSLKSEDFFRILVTELQNQDPFEPAKTDDMISQVSQIRNIELSKNLTDTLSLLSERQQTLGVAELIGKFVTATRTAEDGSQTEIAGIVTGVQMTSDGTAVLELDTGETVLSKELTYVTSLEMLEAMNAVQAAKTDKTDTNKSTTAAQAAASAETAQPDGLLGWLQRLFLGK